MRAKAVLRGTVVPGSRPGFSLLESIVVMFVLGLVMMLGGAILLAAIRMEQATTAAFHDQILRSVLADEFRADVAQAVDAPASVDNVTAGRTCLILRRADGRHVMYRWNNNQLERSELTGSSASRRRLRLGRAAAAVEFTRAGNDSCLLIMRLSESWGSGDKKTHIEIAAALGGDLR